MSQSSLEGMVSKLFKTSFHSKTKIANKVFDWISKDGLASIQTDGRSFWFDLNYPACPFPNDVRLWIIRLVKKEYPNLTYLFD